MKKIIINSSILTQNVNRSFISNGFIKVQNQDIVELGNMVDLNYGRKDDWEIIDGSGYLITPGLINSHTHVGMTLLRGFADDLPLWDWLTKKIWPLEEKLNNEDVYWSSLLGMVEMIKSGTTTFNDMYMFMDETAKAVEVIGMRACLSRGLQGFDQQSSRRLRENLELYYNWHGYSEGRIKVCAGPHAIYTCEPGFWIEVLNMVERTGMTIHTHLSETRLEVNNCIKEHGKTPVKLLKDLGVLKYPVIAAHGVHLTKDDIQIIKENNVSIIHNPGSNLKLGSGNAPLPDLLENGINIALGTDSASSNNNLDMLEEIRLASLIHKGFLEDSTVVKANHALDMATIGGARALNWDDEIGMLDVGKKADLIMINTKDSRFFPNYNMLSDLVYSSNSSLVENVMVNGEWIMRNRKILTIDEGEIYKNIERLKGKFL